jgi:iron(II)-dependent oxidoreductase
MSIETTQPLPVSDLTDMLHDAHERTRALVDGLEGDQLMGPRIAIVNPLLWEIGHVAWFHEHFVLAGLDGRGSYIDGSDMLYDSMKVGHDTRWDLDLPDLGTTLAYMERVRDALCDRLSRKPDMAGVRDTYHTLLTLFHEDMHDEAFTWTRQTLSFPTPDFGPKTPRNDAGPLPGDVEIPGGAHVMGAVGTEPFIFDNEKWGHRVDIKPFAIARAPVTNAEYAAFVGDGGYGDQRFWDEQGWRWRETAAADHPVYWRRDGTGWQAREFQNWSPPHPHAPVIHVNWHEADGPDAACRRKRNGISPHPARRAMRPRTSAVSPGAINHPRRRWPIWTGAPWGWSMWRRIHRATRRLAAAR